VVLFTGYHLILVMGKSRAGGNNKEDVTIYHFAGQLSSANDAFKLAQGFSPGNLGHKNLPFLLLPSPPWREWYTSLVCNRIGCYIYLFYITLEKINKT